MPKRWLLVLLAVAACGGAGAQPERVECDAEWSFPDAYGITCEPACASNAPQPNDMSKPLAQRWSGSSCAVVENEHGATTCETTFDDNGMRGCCAIVDADGDPNNSGTVPVLAFLECAP